MKYLLFIVAAITTCLFSACVFTNELTENEFISGHYKSSSQKHGKERVYVTVSADSINIYQVKKQGGKIISDSAAIRTFALQADENKSPDTKITFTKTTFDLDVLTIPFKYRPAIDDFPNQLNTNFNGAVYIGYRSDKFRLSYSKTPLNIYSPQLIHYAFSFGAFAGIGATTMNPSVTKNMIGYDYDGVVLLNGIAAIIGIEKFTFGLSIGFDTLLDKNKNLWIYQKKPWLGLALGLNLN